jgi:hypothetical protein
MGDDPLAIYKPTGAKSVDAAKAMGNFTGWTFAAVNAIASEVANIQLRLYKVTGDDHEVKVCLYALLRPTSEGRSPMSRSRTSCRMRSSENGDLRQKHSPAGAPGSVGSNLQRRHHFRR